MEIYSNTESTFVQSTAWCFYSQFILLAAHEVFVCVHLFPSCLLRPFHCLFALESCNKEEPESTRELDLICVCVLLLSLIYIDLFLNRSPSLFTEKFALKGIHWFHRPAENPLPETEQRFDPESKLIFVPTQPVSLLWFNSTNTFTHRTLFRSPVNAFLLLELQFLIWFDIFTTRCICCLGDPLSVI